VTAQDLTPLRELLTAVSLPLPLADVDRARATVSELTAQIDDYLLPRLASLDAPLLAVLGGSTGAGKSTLANSLLDADVTVPGVLRPTTRAPVLACNPADRDWFMGDGVLPDLPRLTGRPVQGRTGPVGLHVVPHDAVPSGLGLLDSPDIDSVELANHDLATQLLGAADLWLFITTAARYGDAVPWGYLARARERAAALAVVVNRIPASPGRRALTQIRDDVVRMLKRNGLAGTPVFAIEEGALDEDERIVAGLDPLRTWLNDLVRDDEARRATIRRTVDGALESLPPRIERVAGAVDQQADAAAELARVAERRYAQATQRVRDQLGGGAMLRGEVLDRFREHVGTADWMDRLQRGVGRLRDRMNAALTGDPTPEQQVQGKIRSDLSTLILDAIAAAAEETTTDWERLPGGRTAMRGADAGTVDGADALRRPAASTPPAVDAAVAGWQDAVLAMVRERAGAKASVARGLSVGVNSIGVALMIAVFASTGGLTGGEFAVAGGTAAVSQTLLAAVFGEQAVRDLARDARTDLLERIDAVGHGDRARFDALVDAVPDAAQAEALRTAATTIGGDAMTATIGSTP
jgi:hypothetical protein